MHGAVVINDAVSHRPLVPRHRGEPRFERRGRANSLGARAVEVDILDLDGTGRGDESQVELRRAFGDGPVYRPGLQPPTVRPPIVGLCLGATQWEVVPDIDGADDRRARWRSLPQFD